MSEDPIVKTIEILDGYRAPREEPKTEFLVEPVPKDEAEKIVEALDSQRRLSESGNRELLSEAITVEPHQQWNAESPAQTVGEDDKYMIAHQSGIYWLVSKKTWKAVPVSKSGSDIMLGSLTGPEMINRAKGLVGKLPEANISPFAGPGHTYLGHPTVEPKAGIRVTTIDGPGQIVSDRPRGTVTGKVQKTGKHSHLFPDQWDVKMDDGSRETISGRINTSDGHQGIGWYLVKEAVEVKSEGFEIREHRKCLLGEESSLDDPRVHFNWGYHDAASDVKNKRTKRQIGKGNPPSMRGPYPLNPRDPVYAAGYMAGWDDASAGRPTDSSEPAWQKHGKGKFPSRMESHEVEVTEDLSVANTIRAQIPQGVRMNIGARDFVGDKDSLTFRVGSGGLKKIVIRLDASDTYTVQGWKGKVGDFKKVHEVSDVYVDSLPDVLIKMNSILHGYDKPEESKVTEGFIPYYSVMKGTTEIDSGRGEVSPTIDDAIRRATDHLKSMSVPGDDPDVPPMSRYTSAKATIYDTSSDPDEPVAFITKRQDGKISVVRESKIREEADPPKIAALRKIVSDKQMGKVDGKQVDLFTASAIVAVYDKLEKPENRAKFLTLPIARMASVAFKLMGEKTEGSHPFDESEPRPGTRKAKITQWGQSVLTGKSGSNLGSITDYFTPEEIALQILHAKERGGWVKIEYLDGEGPKPPSWPKGESKVHEDKAKWLAVPKHGTLIKTQITPPDGWGWIESGEVKDEDQIWDGGRYKFTIARYYDVGRPVDEFFAVIRRTQHEARRASS